MSTFLTPVGVITFCAPGRIGHGSGRLAIIAVVVVVAVMLCCMQARSCQHRTNQLCIQGSLFVQPLLFKRPRIVHCKPRLQPLFAFVPHILQLGFSKRLVDDRRADYLS